MDSFDGSQWCESIMGPRPKPLVERFWGKVDKKNGFTPTHMPHLGHCWNWTAGKSTAGYGAIGIGSMVDGSRRMERASRVAWFLVYGKWPDLFVLHRCDNPVCVRPDHLFLGTNADNHHDKAQKKRASGGSSRGETNGSSKLSTEQALEIIRRKKETGSNKSKLAREFGVTNSHICQIGRTCWTHLSKGTTP